MTSDGGDGELAQARGLNAGQIRRLRLTRGLTSEGLRAIPEPALRRALRRLDYPDQPRARMAFRALQSRDERGVITPNALPNAIKEVDSRRMRTALPARVAGVPSGRQVVLPAKVPSIAGLDPGHAGWEALGPGNVGGRTRSIIIHPTNVDAIWAGSVGGGVWHTTDGGTS